MTQLFDHEFVLAIKVYSLFFIWIDWMHENAVLFHFRFINNLNKPKLSKLLLLGLNEKCLVLNIRCYPLFSVKLGLIKISLSLLLD